MANDLISKYYGFTCMSSAQGERKNYICALNTNVGISV